MVLYQYGAGVSNLNKHEGSYPKYILKILHNFLHSFCHIYVKLQGKVYFLINKVPQGK